MVTRSTQFMLVATLGILLSFAFVGMAMANPTPSFTVEQSSTTVPSTVTVKDTSKNPENLPLTYEWAKDEKPGPFVAEVKAGSPECLNAACSEARWTYTAPGSGFGSTYQIGEKVSWPSDWSLTGHSVTVVAASDAPSEITLASPSSVELPADIVLASPKTHMELGRYGLGCYQGTPDPLSGTPVTGSTFAYCSPYLTKRTGPDANGLYQYHWRLPMSQPGNTVFLAEAWSTNPENADKKTLTFTVTGNRLRYGDYRTCQKSDTINLRKTYAYLGFYSSVGTTSVLKYQVRRPGQHGKGWRWVTKKTERQPWEPRTEGGQVLTYEAHLTSLQFSGAPKVRVNLKGKMRTVSAKTRTTYQVKRGNKVVKRGVVSKKSCQQTTLASTVEPPV